MIDYAYYNGVFTPYDSSVIPLSDRSIFFADAVYDVIVGNNGIPYQFTEHIDRLYENANFIGLTEIPTGDEIANVINRLIELSSAKSFIAYIQLSGYGKRRSHYRESHSANLLITVCEYQPPSVLENVRLISARESRHGMCGVKTTNLLVSTLSVNEAHSRAADLSFFVKDGYVTECSNANISLIRGRKLVTHPLDGTVLPGIAQSNLASECVKLGIEWEEGYFTPGDLFYADLVLVSSTTKLLRICTEIDGRRTLAKNIDLAKEIFDKLYADFKAKTSF